MVTLIKNHTLEKIREAGALTDADLSKSLAKDGHVLSDDKFNKLLLDLEILGLVKVAWVTKDERRIEAREEESEESDGRGYADSASGTRSHSSKESDEEKLYEASFPGLEK